MTGRRLLRLGVLAISLCIAPAVPAQGPPTPGQVQEAEEILSAIVKVRSRSIANARTLPTLGAEREGSGILIRDGYVLTIGYLVIESESVEVSTSSGKAVPATLAAYDHATGFGLLRLVAPLEAKPLALGDSATLAVRDPVMIASHGGMAGVSIVHVVSRRPYAGSWEYLLDSAIYTYPATMNWAGAALMGSKAELLGVGSLIVGDAVGTGVEAPGNMFVPIDLLKPILADLIERGRAAGPARPWLGINTEQLRDRLIVSRVSPEGPGDLAGVERGDLVIGVGGEEVSSQAGFYRKLWSLGEAGVEVPLRVLRGTQMHELRIRSIDRIAYFRQKASY